MQLCPTCSTENPDGFRLCGMCGAALQPADVREERKVVSVLFTDLVGFTSRSERLDPEDVRATLSPYYARLREQIEQRGGTVEKFIGDAVMAVFGAPVAHEDDPERAVRTALAIRDAIREEAPELQIRTAVNTGEALVSLGARPSEGEGIVSGDVVNTAARLQAAAPVDGILVGEATYRATRHLIEYRETEPIEAKGKAEPIPVWEAVAARSRFGVDVEQRDRGQLVGREREIAMLTDAFARCRSEQTAQLVTLVGVPGIGKSRLVAELFRMLDQDPELYVWRQGRSLPYGESQSFSALGEIVKAHAGILETDDADTAAGKLSSIVEPLLPETPERQWVELHLRPLAGIGGATESADRRMEAFSAWRRLLEALAEEHPLVLVFEDLHWADDGLLDFVDYLAEWVSGVPMLVVATARPELLDRRSGWGGGKPNATTISIGALSEEETGRLLASLLDQTLLPAEVQAQVLGRAQGNPLYAEEYVRMLQDRGFLVQRASGWQLERSEDLPLPETVQGMIAARVDALTPVEKELIQDAAVIGKVFWPAALGAPDEDALHGLERKEFVRRDRRSAVAGETQYAFLHLLVRDVAYGQIPRARRVEKHRAAAQWIESLARDRSDDRAEMLAHHYGEALRLAAAAGIDSESFRAPARAAFAEAAEHAIALNSWTAALEFAGEGLALTDDDDPERPRLQLRHANAAWFVGADDPDELIASRDGFLAQGDDASAAEAAALLARVLWHRGDGNGSRAAAAQALALAERLPVSASTTRAFAQEARASCLQGEVERALELGRRTLAMSDEVGRSDLASHALNTIGMARVVAGDAGGLEDLERSAELAEQTNALDAMGSARNNLANNLWQVGRVEDGAAQIAAAREIYVRFGLTQALRWNDGEQMCIGDLRGDFDAVIDAVKRFLASPAAEERYQAAAAWIFRANVQLARGLVDDAVAESQRALERARRGGGDPQQLGPALVAAARALSAAGRDAESDALVAEVLADPRLLMEHWTYHLPLFLAERGRGDEYLAATEQRPGYLWQRAGRAAAAGDFVAAAERYDEIGARYPEAWARLLGAEHGQDVDLARADAYFERVGAAPYTRRCEALLPASA